MKRLFTLILTCAICALSSCKSSEEYNEFDYDLVISDLSVTFDNHYIVTKDDALNTSTGTISFSCDRDDFPIEALNIACSNESVATIEIVDEKIILTGVATGDVSIYVAYEDQIASCDLKVSEKYFPDAGFVSALIEDYGFVDDGTYDIDPNNSENAELFATTTDLNLSIQVPNVLAPSSNAEIADFTGIHHFTALEKLSCDSVGAEILDVSSLTKLKELYCSGNNLTELNIGNCTELTHFGCSDNNLSELNIDNCTELTHFGCSDNNLSELNVKNCTELEALYCSEMFITSLDLSGLTKLRHIGCDYNQISSLNLSGCIALEYLMCDGNTLASLDVSDCVALKTGDLYCGDQENVNGDDLTNNVTMTQDQYDLPVLGDSYNSNVIAVNEDGVPFE